jgi:hypothetical protein
MYYSTGIATALRQLQEYWYHMQEGLRRGAYGTVLLWRMVGALMVYIGEGMQERHALICTVVPLLHSTVAPAHSSTAVATALGSSINIKSAGWSPQPSGSCNVKYPRSRRPINAGRYDIQHRTLAMQVRPRAFQCHRAFL